MKNIIVFSVALFFTFIGVNAHGLEAYFASVKKHEHQVWQDAGFKDVESFQLQLDYNTDLEYKLTHKISLELVIFRGSGWRTSDLPDRIVRLGKMFAKCRIQLVKINILVVTPPESFFLDVDIEFGIEKIIKMAPIRIVTRVYYIKSLSSGSNALSGAERYWGVGHPRTHHIWMTSNVIGWERENLRKGSNFVIEAHELGHNLLDMGHLPYGSTNFMAKASSNEKIYRWQCEKMRQHPLVN